MNTRVTVKQLSLSKSKNAQLKQSQNKKVRVSLSIDQNLLTLIDEMKGLASRSALVEKLLKDQLSINHKEN